MCTLGKSPIRAFPQGREHQCERARASGDGCGATFRKLGVGACPPYRGSAPTTLDTSLMTPPGADAVLHVVVSNLRWLQAKFGLFALIFSNFEDFWRALPSNAEVGGTLSIAVGLRRSSAAFVLDELRALADLIFAGRPASELILGNRPAQGVHKSIRLPRRLLQLLAI